MITNFRGGVLSVLAGCVVMNAPSAYARAEKTIAFVLIGLPFAVGIAVVVVLVIKASKPRPGLGPVVPAAPGTPRPKRADETGGITLSTIGMVSSFLLGMTFFRCSGNQLNGMSVLMLLIFAASVALLVLSLKRSASKRVAPGAPSEPPATQDRPPQDPTGKAEGSDTRKPGT